MALTRKYLEGMGIEEKQVESIIEAHAETVDGLKAKIAKSQEEAKKVPELQRQLEEAKSASAGSDEWEKKYNEERKAFEDFKTRVENERAEAEKAKAYRDMLASAGIDQRRLDAIMRLTDLTKVTMKDGKLEGADELKKQATDEWSDFIVKKRTVGSNPAEPPKATNGIEGADPEITKRLKARHERLYGKTADERE